MKQLWLKFAVVALAIGLVTASAGSQPQQRSSEFSVQFTDCIETIGVGLVSTDAARALIPQDFILVGEGTPVTPIVVRTARCGGISVDGHPTQPGIIVQVGLVIVPPDFTGDINNYTLWYYTTDGELAGRLRDLGLDAQHVQNIAYNLDLNAGALNVNVALPGTPALSLNGTVFESTVPIGSFTANWWAKMKQGIVKMNTVVPSISIGGANLLLTTTAGNALAGLIGGTALGFPIIQQFNLFSEAHMAVSVK
jgi:hypothetical protein